MTATDWDAYYARTPRYTSVTRRLSTAKLIGVIRNEFDGAPLRICELGGANSCFLEAFAARLNVIHYHVIDLNAFGLNLLRTRRPRCHLTFEHDNVLTRYEAGSLFDLVYSVGLIEHFDVADTARAIDSHFARCRPGGLVLVTFPTPTWPYRLIRGLAERSGTWAFPDERPLLFDEVLGRCGRYGAIVHRSINWWIGLTQGYVAVRKAP